MGGPGDEAADINPVPGKSAPSPYRGLKRRSAMPDHPVPQDRPPLDDGQRRNLDEKVGYDSATYQPAMWRDSDQPYRHYWRALYPEYADPEFQAHWYAKWKTSEMAMGLFGERQRARHEWIASGPRRGREEAHATAVVTYHASPVRSRTVRVCLVCLWVSADLDAEHG